MSKLEASMYLRNAVRCCKGDDLERAERYFHGMTPDELQKQHGVSGRTRQQVLDDYRQDRAAWKEASDYLEALLAADTSRGRK